jgi:hypothetical protein
MTMNDKARRLAAALFAATMLATMVASGASAHGDDRESRGHDLARARHATAQFRNLATAVAAGYGLPPAPAPLHSCISSLTGPGAMGFHYINGSLLDTTVDPARPEVLVYAPDRSGRLHLVALEYVVFQAPWKAAHGDTVPMLFGQMFMATGEPNRYDIPAFFSLHVWLWKHNPAGLFAPFNPKVSCDPSGPPRHDDDRAGAATAALFACAIDRAPKAATTART